MNGITTKQYQIMTDQNIIWNFMVDIFERGWANGAPAPFLEYALNSSWMDISYQYLNRIWFDGDKVVGFVFNESPITDVYFSLRPGYEALADEMVKYADENMPNFNNERAFMLFGGQKVLMSAAEKIGYGKICEWGDMLFDFKNELNHTLPSGFHFVEPKNFDPLKLAICCWKGFNHEEDKGSFVGWDAPDPGTPWSPSRAMRGIMKVTLAPPPHSTQEYDIIIANEAGEYVCYSGMWWVKENKLAYMEPLCTIPEYRRKGLAAAALSEHYRRMKKLGATIMTGGGDPFYRALGYEDGILWTKWMKQR